MRHQLFLYLLIPMYFCIESTVLRTISHQLLEWEHCITNYFYYSSPINESPTAYCQASQILPVRSQSFYCHCSGILEIIGDTTKVIGEIIGDLPKIIVEVVITVVKGNSW